MSIPSPEESCTSYSKTAMWRLSLCQGMRKQSDSPECTTQCKENRTSFHVQQPHRDSRGLEWWLHYFFSRLFSRELLLKIFCFRSICIDYTQTSCWPQGYTHRVYLLIPHPAFVPDPQRFASSRAKLGVSSSNKSQISKLNSVTLLGFNFHIKSIHNYGDRGMQELWCTQKAGEL